MEDYIYNGIVQNISKKFEHELLAMKAEYNFDLGDEFEIAVCKVLRRLLPAKYGVCRGFVFDKTGNKGGDDIIIYDRESFPTLRFFDIENEYDRKNQIPAESVYAYIEAKHTLDANTIKKAFDQVVAVKKLCYNRNHCAIRAAKPCAHIFNNQYSKEHGWEPAIADPVYTMILAKNCVGVNGKKAVSGNDAQSFLLEQFNDILSDKIREANFYNPDSIIAGNLTTAFCGHYIFDANGNLKDSIQITKFYTGVKPYACYQVNSNENIAYGLAFVHLMMALQFIKLPNMPWDMIFNTAKIPDKKVREDFLSNL